MTARRQLPFCRTRERRDDLLSFSLYIVEIYWKLVFQQVSI